MLPLFSHPIYTIKLFSMKSMNINACNGKLFALVVATQFDFSPKLCNVSHKLTLSKLFELQVNCVHFNQNYIMYSL